MNFDLPIRKDVKAAHVIEGSALIGAESSIRTCM